MNALYDFILMGGYGGYIWGCYAITSLGFISLWLFVKRNKMLALKRILQSQNRERSND